MKELRVDGQIPFLYCRDLGKASDFYEGIMGFELVLDQGDCRIVQTTERGGGYLGYCAREGGASIKKGLILTLVTSQVDEWYAYLRGRGVDVVDEPQLNPEYDIYHFFFRDPDGYLLELQSFQDLDWAADL